MYVIEKISDLVKEKLAKNMKEIKSNIQNKHALSIDVGKVVV